MPAQMHQSCLVTREKPGGTTPCAAFPSSDHSVGPQKRSLFSKEHVVTAGQQSFRGIGKPRSPTLVLIAFLESLRLFQKRINSRAQEMRTEPTCFWLKKFWEPRAFVRTKQSLGDRKDWNFRRCIDGFNPALLRGTSLCSSPGKQISLICGTPATLQRVDSPRNDALFLSSVQWWFSSTQAFGHPFLFVNAAQLQGDLGSKQGAFSW